MSKIVLILLFCLIAAGDNASAQPVRGAFPSPSIQILPLMVASERGFFKREGLELELIFVRGATTAVQAFGAGRHFEEIGALNAAVQEALSRAASVLVKGSRFMKMERVVEAVSAGAAPTEESFHAA